MKQATEHAHHTSVCMCAGFRRLKEGRLSTCCPPNAHTHLLLNSFEALHLVSSLSGEKRDGVGHDTSICRRKAPWLLRVQSIWCTLWQRYEAFMHHYVWMLDL